MTKFQRMAVLALGLLLVVRGVRASDSSKVDSSINPVEEPFSQDAHVSLRVPLQSRENFSFAGDVQWTHIWKGFGALAGAYIFAALASRGFAQHENHRGLTSLLRSSGDGRLDHYEQEAPLEARARVR